MQITKLNENKYNFFGRKINLNTILNHFWGKKKY